MDINIFDNASIKAGITEINKTIENLKKADEVMNQLSDVGLTTAMNVFYSISDPNYSVDLVRKVKTENGYQIQARGDKVAYAEFGAGVFYNGHDAYNGERVPGMDGIGYHHIAEPGTPSWGQNDFWYYPGGITQGIGAKQGMYRALRAMEAAAPKVIEEVFKKHD